MELVIQILSFFLNDRYVYVYGKNTQYTKNPAIVYYESAAGKSWRVTGGAQGAQETTSRRGSNLLTWVPLVQHSLFFFSFFFSRVCLKKAPPPTPEYYSVPSPSFTVSSRVTCDY